MLDPARRPELPVLTISQLTHAIKLSLEATFPLLCVKGEVSNFKRQSSGHLYFSLKDADAQISAVMFRGHAALLKTLPKEGDQVVVQGELTVYPPRGNYQLVIQTLTLAGIGALLQKLEELKAKLQARGWFAKEHKKPIPKFPQRIGVITSPTGAAIQDMLHILTRRFSSFHLILNPVKVQGEGAAAEIAQAIEQMNRYQLADVLIVGRGGGSIEDLWAFNEERVAEAIYNSKIPIISAVGHETDFTLADFVADVRAPTPSAAAEIVIAEKAHQLHQLIQMRTRLQQTAKQLIRQTRQQLTAFQRHPLFASPYTLLGHKLQRLDQLRGDLDQAIHKKLLQTKLTLQARKQQALALRPSLQIAHSRQRLELWDQAIRSHMIHTLRRLKQTLEGKIEALRGIDPKKLLTRGYSILFAEKQQTVITSVRALSPGQQIRLLLADGEASAEIKHIYPQEP